MKALVLALLLVAAAPAAADHAARCGNVTGSPPPQIGWIRATGTSCSTARALARAWKLDRGVSGWRDCPDARHTCGAILRFRCALYTPDPRYPGSFMRCARGRARVRWAEG